MGEMLLRTKRAKGGERGGKKALDGTRKEPSNPPPTLADLGVTKKESSEAQAVAGMPVR